MGDTAMRALHAEDADNIDHSVKWEICVGCACYKVETEDWKRGWEFKAVMHEDCDYEYLHGSEWDILHRRIEEGSFCGSCGEVLDDYGFSWGVGICARIE